MPVADRQFKPQYSILTHNCPQYIPIHPPRQVVKGTFCLFNPIDPSRYILGAREGSIGRMQEIGYEGLASWWILLNAGNRRRNFNNRRNRTGVTAGNYPEWNLKIICSCSAGLPSLYTDYPVRIFRSRGRPREEPITPKSIWVSLYLSTAI